MITFFHGVMDSGKSAQIIDLTYIYEKQFQSFALFVGSPKEKKNNNDYISIKSRKYPNVKLMARVIYRDTTEKELVTMIKDEIANKKTFCVPKIIIDESQFLSDNAIDVICNEFGDKNYISFYGLLRDYLGKMFASSKKIIEYADEIKNIERPYCDFCEEERATHHILTIGKQVINYEGVFDTNITVKKSNYNSICGRCFRKEMKLAKNKRDDSF